ncbi:hypothetical protein EYF80_008521 [Liparis tanakae]|uniref:Uncharacterized protein n=1 Tax=Liparis tanakae TaxID=230148 RepID=A0A4Z2ITW5_9TELE|nr:hypothetical protein EYF80_008521 [Liparis tanakae]
MWHNHWSGQYPRPLEGQKGETVSQRRVTSWCLAQQEKKQSDDLWVGAAHVNVPLALDDVAAIALQRLDCRGHTERDMTTCSVQFKMMCLLLGSEVIRPTTEIQIKPSIISVHNIPPAFSCLALSETKVTATPNQSTKTERDRNLAEILLSTAEQPECLQPPRSSRVE